MTKKPLDRLERKIRLLVDALEAEREENARLRRKLGAGEEAHPEPPAPEDDTGAESSVERQLRLLEEERAAIRDRVEHAITLLEETP